MSEVLTAPQAGASTEVATPAQTAEQTGRFNRLRELGSRAYSLLDLAAGISNVNSHIDSVNALADGINERYNGLPGRQTSGETMSMQVEDDIRITFRRDAQRAGYTDVDTMPADLRAAAAELAARSHRADVVNELQANHTDWTTERIEAAADTLISDIAAVLAMDSDQHQAYEADLFKYQEVTSRIPDLIAERTDLRTEYNARVRAIGRAALQSLVNMAGAVRNAPTAINAAGTVVFMGAATSLREWYATRTGEQKKLVWLSAASVAFAGIASYLAVRYGAGMGHGGESGQPRMQPVGFSTSTGENIGAPSQGEVIGVNYGEPIGNPAESIGTGTTIGEPIGNAGSAAGESIGGPQATTTGESIGSPASTGGEPIGSSSATATSGEPIGSSSATNGEPIGRGSNAGESIGTSGAETLPGLDLRHATTTKEIFASKGQVSAWPDTVTVSRYNAANHDGSLWGISTEMLERSGIAHPSDAQITELVDTLRPQAQPNGFLNEGQTLDLRPAVEALQHIS